MAEPISSWTVSSVSRPCITRSWHPTSPHPTVAIDSSTSSRSIASCMRHTMTPSYTTGLTGGWELPNWVQGYEKHWREAAETLEGTEAESAAFQAENAKKFGEHLKDITEQYQISYIELDRDLELDKVCDIFTKLNSRGVRLDIFDLLNALLRPKEIRLRQDLWRDASPRLEFAEAGRMNVYVLQVMSILRQAYCSPKYLYNLIPGSSRQVRGPDGTLRSEVLVADPIEFKNLWHEAVEALERALNLLRHPQEFGAISSQYLPYAAILPVFAALQVEAGQLPAEQRLDAQRKIRLWYWASVFTNRYSGAVESTAAQDYRKIKTWYVDGSGVLGRGRLPQGTLRRSGVRKRADECAGASYGTRRMA